MKKMFKNLCIFALLFSLLSSNLFFVCSLAYDASSEGITVGNDIVSYLETYARISIPAERRETPRTVRCSYPLHSFDENTDYSLYLFDPEGYAIFENNSFTIEEMSIYGSAPYDCTTRADYYYGGPMNYFVGVGNMIQDIQTQTILTENDITTISRNVQRITGSRENYRAPVRRIITKSLTDSAFFTTDLGSHYDYNDDGICGQIASEILLIFFARNVNRNFIPLQYRYRAPNSMTISGVEVGSGFLDLLFNTSMGDGGMFVNDLCLGLNEYFEDQELDYAIANYIFTSTNSHVSVYQQVSRNITSCDYPMIISMSTSYNDACPYNHFVVVYKYVDESYLGSLVSRMYYVHTGWHHDPLLSFSWDWFDEGVYVNID